jgi:flagellar motor component MotA
MYITALIVFLLAIVYSILLCSNPVIFLDIPSILIIILLTVPMLMAAGLGGDLIRAFKLMIRKNHPYTTSELQRAHHAVDYTIKLLWYAGFIGSFIGLVSMLRNLTDPTTIGPNAAVMILTVFYALFASFFFLPIRAKLKAMLITKDL